MFLVNRLFGINGPSPAAELTTIDGGRLFLVRPDSIKGSRECIFIDASLSIRRSTYNHNYQLVVTRTFQEGEEQLLEEDAENSDERAFLLDTSLFMSLGPTLDPSAPIPPPLSFTWLDPDGDGPDDEFEFVLSESGPSGREIAQEFEGLAWRCMWERSRGRSWPTEGRELVEAEASLEAEFKVERSSAQTKSKDLPLFRPATPSESEEDEGHHQRYPTRLEQENTASGDDHNDDASSDGDDEVLAAALMQKATISPSSSSGAPPALGSTPSIETQTTPRGKGAGAKAAAAAAAAASASRFASTSTQPIEPALSSSQRPPTHVTPSHITASDSDPPLVSVRGELHLFDRNTGLFMLQEENVLATIHKSSNEFSRSTSGSWLLIQGQHGAWVSLAIDSDTGLTFSERERAMVFNFTYDGKSASIPTPTPTATGPPSPSSKESTSLSDGQTYTWLVRFLDQGTFDTMQEGVSTALFEGKFGTGSWKKLKEDERGYQKTAYIEDAEMYGIEEEGEGEAAALAAAADQEEEEEDDEESTEGEYESDEDERPRFNSKSAKAKNSQLAVGYKEDLSFVVQGDMIGVFKQQREGGKKLKFVTSIVNIATPSGKKGFTPNKVMLHNQDTSMILQNPLAPGALYRLDLETGKVVDEYKVSDHFSVSSFLPDSKFAQTTQQQTFIGLSHNGVFRVDPRLAGNKLVESEFKQYATKNDFSVAATTESGRLAIASNKGDIRLFDKLGKNAKTALPALGDPIIGVDVSADGKWVLATCKTYLLLIDTTIPESSGSKYSGSSGFDRSFPAAMKPVPKRLQLKPEHAAHMQEQSREGVSFTPAKFNSGVNEAERTIVTSTGPYVVAWNFKHVKAGNITNYTLRRFSDTIIADNFKFGGDREIIVTLPENVFVEEKKKLKAPTRDSISQIVQTWD